MASVAAPAAAVTELTGRWAGRLAVAAVNGPPATVVSGDPQAVAELAQACAADGVRARMLPVDYASHGPQVESLREEILELLGPVSAGPGADPDDLRDDRRAGGRAGAGRRLLVRQPARAGVVRRRGQAAGAGRAPGVHRGVPAPGADRRHHRDPGRGRGDRHAAPRRRRARAVPVQPGRGARPRRGVDWAALLAGGPRVDLPTYAFQRQRYWPPRRGGRGMCPRRAWRRWATRCWARR